ncbi:alpha-(1,3)-fucosyltransferase C-like [Amyelois transitella]|uniref:alpha-(1,3)-fucosyltransferase C-like n=1 Tax=Amyelois transitella TaxID=680683 RepID=UPI002990035B|nr:alpha-(1,3)-fucosyltransferase C-like [Amyelois transitella]
MFKSPNGPGQKVFIDRNCKYTNCFVSWRRYINDYQKFHTIIITMREAIHYSAEELPRFRTPYQKFVASSFESSHNYPVCSNRFNDYFNWTWTFRLDSDCRLEYIAIRDEHGKVIGPKKTMHWMKVRDMSPNSEELKNSLLSKSRAAAWFVSNCVTQSGREIFAKKLAKELAIYNHTIDVYGDCGNLSCSKRDFSCMKMIRTTYYFYLSFENSFSKDYVTEKLLHALQNNAIPIVYGGANYTRFMPDGIYLNAIKLGVKALAKKMDNFIRSRKRYAKYFKWKNHYSYHSRSESKDTDDYCAFCKLLNNEKKFKEKSVVKNFRKWWDSPDFCSESDKKGFYIQE